MGNPMVAEAERMFRISGMVDHLRDAADTLYQGGTADQQTVDLLAAQYARLRGALCTTLTDAGAQELEAWVPAPGSVQPSAAGVFYAAGALARMADVLHQTPEFTLAQQVKGVQASKVLAQVVPDSGTTPDEANLPAGALPGQYL